MNNRREMIVIAGTTRVGKTRLVKLLMDFEWSENIDRSIKNVPTEAKNRCPLIRP